MGTRGGDVLDRAGATVRGRLAFGREVRDSTGVRCLIPILTLLLACDLQPPKQKAPPAPAPASTINDAMPGGPPVAPMLADAGVAVAADATVVAPVAVIVDAGLATVDSKSDGITEACLAVSAHIAEVLIAAEPDSGKKAAFEQDRTKMVRNAGMACTNAKWPDASLKCFIQAADPQAIETCGKGLPH